MKMFDTEKPLNINEVESLFSLMVQYKIGCFKFGKYEIHKTLHEMPVVKKEQLPEPDPFENLLPK